MNGDIGVVIVTYNSADVCAACLDSCRGLKTVVVDNASTDGTLEQVRRSKTEIIANSANLGFAQAVNQGVRRLDTEFILLLNPDVRLLTPIAPLLEACSLPGTAAACGQLVHSVGTPQAGFTVRRFPTPTALIFEILGVNRLWPANPANRHYRYRDLDLTQPSDVEQPAGAFLLFRKSVWQRIGGFDPRFHPVWFEDVDFCYRIAAQGLRIRYIPEVKAEHLGGSSISKLSWGCREVYWYGSLLRYAVKHFHRGAFRGVSLAVVLGSVLRAFLGVARRRNREPLSAFARVVRLALVCAVRGHMPEPEKEKS